MRDSSTYRTARKAFVKRQADEAGKKFRDVWPTSVHRKAPPPDVRTAGTGDERGAAMIAPRNVIILAVAALLGLALYLYFSPYQQCVR